LDTVGQCKTSVMAERMRSINPGVELQEINEFYLPENHDLFFGGRLDYIVDAIDTVKSKIDLIVEADRRGIPIISSMGAGNKLNPAQLEVSDIYKTSVCPLARALRQKLKKLGIRKLKVVYSKEEPLKPMVIEGHTEEPPGSRHTVPGSVSFVPSVAGLIAASEVVKDLVKARASDRLQS
ncbi:ThiF family adenylyltransferase, partial [Anaerovibrio slackiae]|uniref:tRNA threonylcarbamoyladenosine dehydratase n=1 Tax=Anaerovibrio slackiae TaxID=2652309 RepID=UPI0038646123